MALDADHLLTLTKRGKFDSIDDAWEVFERFNRYMRRMFKARWRYVCVPEQHADGSYHLHVAIKGFFWVGLLRKLTSAALLPCVSFATAGPYDDITSAVDFAAVATAVGVIAGLIAVALVAKKGARMVLSMIGR